MMKRNRSLLAVILALGTVTMLLGAVLALFSIDLKRTLACSSMSQIGFILVGVGMMCLLGEENALAARGTVLHMVNHSCFKLVLFLCAGAVFRNLHKLDLNEIRGFGRKKPLLMVCFLLGALGIGGIPLLNGYVSKTLLHEAIVEGVPHYGGILKLVEWIFLFSGGLTLAYMTKLFAAVFVERHPTRQAEFDGMRRWISLPAAIALSLSALVIPVLGLTADTTMNGLAELAMDFLHGGHLHHGVRYLSPENLKGAAISVAIGAAVYLGVVRTWMIRKGRYVNRWPARLDLEDLLYRPLLLRWLPGLLGRISALFGENRLTKKLCAGVLGLGSWAAGLFGENRLTKKLAAKTLQTGDRVGVLFGENRVTAQGGSSGWGGSSPTPSPTAWMPACCCCGGRCSARARSERKTRWRTPCPTVWARGWMRLPCAWAGNSGAEINTQRCCIAPGAASGKRSGGSPPTCPLRC